MKKKIQKLTKHPLFSGSLMMMIGTNFSNFLMYIYHFLIGRMLGPAVYSEVVALISITSLLGIIPTSIGPTVIKFISSTDEKHLPHLVTWFVKKTLIVAVVSVIVLLPFSFLIANFIKLDQVFYIILIILTVFFSLQVLLDRSILQGVLKFNKLVISLTTETFVRFSVTIILVYFGFSLFGAVIGLVMSSIATFFLTRAFISRYLPKNFIHDTAHIKIKSMMVYSIPVIISSFTYTSFFTSDILLVKHYFSAHDAGIYAAMSYFGKVILFGTGPIASVMFPIIAKRQANGEKYLKIFYTSFIVTMILALCALTIFWIFPKLLITIVYGKAYLEGSALLIKFGIFATLFSLGTLLSNFHVSLSQTKSVIFPAIASILQIVGIFFFHDSLQTILTVSIISASFMLISLLVYFSVTHHSWKSFRPRYLFQTQQS